MSALGKYDVIYCDPPWEEYEKRAKRLNIYSENTKHYKSRYHSMLGMSVEELKKIKVGDLGDSPSFIFLWVGCEHL